MASDTVLASRGRPFSLEALHQNRRGPAHERDENSRSGTVNDDPGSLQEICHLFERGTAELRVSCSLTRDQARDLAQQLAEEGERSKDCEEVDLQIVLQKKPLPSKASEKEEKPQTQLNDLQMTMSESADESWRKARLLKEQEKTLCDLQSSVEQLREQSQAWRLLVEGKSAEVKNMSCALAEALKKVDELSSEATTRIRPVEDLGETEREQYDAERRLRKLAERKVKRQKKQLLSLKSGDKKELGLMKAEICELTESVKDFEAQRFGYEKTLLTETRRAAERDQEISRLQAHANSKEQIAAGLSNELSDYRAREAVLMQRLQDKDTQLRHTEDDLKILRGSVHKLATHVGGLRSLQSLIDSLTRLQTGQGRVCAGDHHDYRYVTDCGVLLCTLCLRENVPHDIDGAFSSGSQVSMELDCRWCGAGFWTWQPLPIAYSTGWIVEMKRLYSAVSGVVSSLG